jgi:cytochrome P450
VGPGGRTTPAGCATVGSVPGLPDPRPAELAAGRGAFPLGAAVTRAGLDTGLHPVLARLRAAEPVSWLPVLGGWLVTSRELALRVLRDSAAFTVDDPRFSTARVVGPSMLSLDGAEHGRHRAPFSHGFSHREIRSRLAGYVTAEADRLVTGLAPAGAADLRLGLAAPLAAAVMAQALGLGQADPGTLLGWYGAIVAAVSDLAGAPDAPVSPAGAAAFRMLDASLREVIGGSGPGQSLLADSARDALAGTGATSGPAGIGPPTGSPATSGHPTGSPVTSSHPTGSPAGIGHPTGSPPTSSHPTGSLATGEVVSNAAVLLFGGIETTEGMISNVIWHLLRHPDQLALVRAEPGLIPAAVEESVRLEPAAAVVDRYATRATRIGAAAIRRGDLVTVSLAGAGRDPAVFSAPDTFDVRRPNARAHLAFAHGPHFCLGAHLARLEVQAAVRAVLRLPGLRLDPDRPSAPRGLVFRKPPSLAVQWDGTAAR